MKDKQLNPQESVAIISQMIEATRHRISMPDIRISAMWGILTIAVAALVLALMLCGCSPWVNFIWFAIPFIGLPVSKLMERKQQPKQVQTYIDRIIRNIWKAVGYIAIFVSLVCLGFNIAGMPQAWLAMFFYAYIIVGFGGVAEGIVIRETSYIIGGLFSIIAGFVMIILTICGISLLAVWAIPVYMFSFLMTFIVPAFILQRKYKAEKQ